MYLAKAKAGHDKGRLYLVCDEDEGFVYLADGDSRPVSHPKKKKRIHIQPVIHFPAEVRALLEDFERDRKTDPDVRVKRILKTYKAATEKAGATQTDAAL